jgi:hypothetical protein
MKTILFLRLADLFLLSSTIQPGIPVPLPHFRLTFPWKGTHLNVRICHLLHSSFVGNQYFFFIDVVVEDTTQYLKLVDQVILKLGIW